VAIYEPQPKLSSTERALLVLLAQLVTGQTTASNNLPPDSAILSDAEAVLLIELLEEFSSTRKFVESAHFVERITQANIDQDSDIREIFLSWRKFYGRSRAMASTHWHDFLHRFGRIRSQYGYVRGLAQTAGEMPYYHFREMERLLLNRSNVGDRVKAIVLSVVDKYESEVEAARGGQFALPPGTISKLPAKIVMSLRHERKDKLGKLSLSSAQAAGLMTVLTDVSVLFTTRDWGVAGTLSTIDGGLAATAHPKD
jgi:hypothetical protein